MLNSKEIAKYFIAISDPQSGDEMTNLRLQKLLYFAQGCFLAKYHKPLFDEKIKSWKDGPVVPQVYHEYKNNGSNIISPMIDFDIDNLDEDVRDMLDIVYYNFINYSAWRLREITHSHDIVNEAYQNKLNSGSDEIDVKKMEDFFLENFKEFIDGSEEDEDKFLGEMALKRYNDPNMRYVKVEC